VSARAARRWAGLNFERLIVLLPLLHERLNRVTSEAAWPLLRQVILRTFPQ